MTEVMQLPNTKASPVALTIQPGLDFDAWQDIGKQLGRVNQGLLWWIGDWLNYGESSYGETYAQAMDVTGKAYATVKQAAYMARKYPPEVRKDTLTFSHYGVVAGLDNELSDRLLLMAEENSWTVGQLKEQRTKMEDAADPKPEKPPAMVCCPACGAEFPATDFKVKLDS